MVQQRRLVIKEIECRSALNRTGIPGFDYCLNPYSGCSHNCCYCYAGFTRRFTGRTEAWGEFVDVKVNFPETLRRQLKGKRPPQGRVILGTVTDPYQPLEAGRRVTRAALEVLAEHPGLELNILTKSDLIVRDVDLFARFDRCSIGFTITSLNDAAVRELEPGATPPSGRLRAAKALVEAGLRVWIFIAPLLPGLGDSYYSLSRLLKGVTRAGIREVQVDLLNPYTAVVKRLGGVYRERFPDALPRLEWYLSDPDGYRESLSLVLKRCYDEFGYDLCI